MNKQEILERHKASKHIDEGLEYIESNGAKYASIIYAICIMGLIPYNIYKGIDNHSNWFMLYAGGCAYNYGKYKVTKKMSNIIWAIVLAIFALDYLKGYIISTM